jgi:hypothetical protein
VITGGDLAEGVPEIQKLALSVIRSLVEDGLMKFEGWDDVGIDEAMGRVRSLFVDQYDIPERGYSLSGSRRLNPADARQRRLMLQQTSEGAWLRCAPSPARAAPRSAC